MLHHHSMAGISSIGEDERNVTDDRSREGTMPSPHTAGVEVGRMRNQLEDHGRHYGHFWFGGGYIPDTHVVGKPHPAAQRPVGANSSGASRSVDVQQQPHYHDVSSYLQAQRQTDGCGSASGTPNQHQRVGAAKSTPKVLPSPLTVTRAQTPPASSPWSGRRRSDMVGPSTPPSSARRVAAPFAEHYPTTVQVAGQLEEHNSSFLSHAQGTPMRTSTGIPRGYGGLDSIPAAARMAQRNIEAMQQDAAKLRKIELQRNLKLALDQQLQEKQERKLKEWEAEAVAVYGPALSLDDTQRRAKSKSLHNSLQGAWKHQANEAAKRKAEEDAYYKPYEEDWNDLKQDMQRLRNDSLDDRIQKRQASWLEAWKDHQATEGELRKAAVQERYREEQMSIAPNIANYSDRILLAEQQKRESQRQYQQELNDQVEQRNQQKYQDLVAEQEEMLYGPPPQRRNGNNQSSRRLRI